MRTILLALPFLLPVAALAADPKPSAAPLVEQLGDRDFKTREAAGRKLLELGEPALAALEAGLDSPVPEVASRCADLLVAVKRKIDADAVLAPSLVELPDGERTVRQAFDAIEKQTRYKLVVTGDQGVLSSKITLKGGKVPFWEAVVAVCEACKLEVKEVTPDPATPTGTVALQPRTGVVRTTVHNALMVQVTPPNPVVRAAHTSDLFPLSVRVFPEPRVRWQRLTDVALAKASAPDGKELRSGILPPPPRVLLDEERMIRGRRRIPVELPTGFTDAATRWVLTLAADPDGPTEVGTLSALLRATVWKEAGEVAVVKLKDGDTEGTTDGPHGTTLGVKVIGPIANHPDETMIEVSLRWVPDRVRPDADGAVNGGSEGVWFEPRDGKLVPVKAAAAEGKGGVRPDRWGIVAADAGGEPLTLTAGGVKFGQAVENGRVVSTATVEYVVRKPEKSSAGKLAAVAFHAQRVVEVSVPLRVKDIPLAAGTAEPDATTEPTHPKK